MSSRSVLGSGRRARVPSAVMDCPHCRIVLEKISIDDLELDSCGSCKGLWFGRGELREAKDLAEPMARWMDFDLWRHQCCCRQCSRWTVLRAEEGED